MHAQFYNNKENELEDLRLRKYNSDLYRKLERKETKLSKLKEQNIICLIMLNHQTLIIKI